MSTLFHALRAPLAPEAHFLSRLLPLALLAVLVGCQTVRVDDALGEAAAPETAAPIAPPLEQAWRVGVEAAFGPDAPTVTADGRVVVGMRDGRIAVVDMETGSRVGSGDLNEAVEGPIAISGPMLYAPLAETRAGIVAYNAVHSSKTWSLDQGPHLAGPLVMGAVLVTAAHDGTVRGIERATGHIVWSARPDSIAQIRATPIAARGLALVIDTEGAVRAYDPVSGRIEWTADAGAPVYRTPALRNDLLVVPTTRGRLAAFDATTGEERWSAQIGPLARWATPALSEDIVIAGATDGVLRGLDPATGTERWSHTFDGTVSAAPLLSGPVVYVGTFGRTLAALDAATGADLWSHELPGRIKSGLVASDGTLVVLAEPRYIYGFRPTAVASR